MLETSEILQLLVLSTLILLTMLVVGALGWLGVNLIVDKVLHRLMRRYPRLFLRLRIPTARRTIPYGGALAHHLQQETIAGGVATYRSSESSPADASRMPWPESRESEVGKWIVAGDCAVEYWASRRGAFQLNQTVLQAVRARVRGQSLELRVSHSVVTPWLITFLAMLLVASGAFVFGPNNVSSITFLLAIPALFICFGLTWRNRGRTRQAGVELLERLEQHFTSLDEQRAGASSPPKLRIDIEGPHESEHVGDDVGARHRRAELAQEV